VLPKKVGLFRLPDECNSVFSLFFLFHNSFVYLKVCSNHHLELNLCKGLHLQDKHNLVLLWVSDLNSNLLLLVFVLQCNLDFLDRDSNLLMELLLLILIRDFQQVFVLDLHLINQDQ
jgi:hypothetical protein